MEAGGMTCKHLDSRRCGLKCVATCSTAACEYSESSAARRSLIITPMVPLVAINRGPSKPDKELLKPRDRPLAERGVWRDPTGLRQNAHQGR